MKLKNNLIGGLAAIVLSASSSLTLGGQDQKFLKFKDTEPNKQLYSKLEPKEIEQTPKKYLKTFMKVEPNIVIYDIPNNILIKPTYIPEPETKRFFQKYDKLKINPKTGAYE